MQTIITGVSRELSSAADRLFPDEMDPKKAAWTKELTCPEIPGDLERNALIVETTASGYVQACGLKELTKLVAKEHLIIKLLCRPGDFLVSGAALANVWPRKLAEKSEVSGPIRRLPMNAKKSKTEVVFNLN